MNKAYYKKSASTGLTYNTFACINIINPKQAAYFCYRNIQLKDIFVSMDRETGDPIFVYVFLKEDTKEVFDEWCKRKK